MACITSLLSCDVCLVNIQLHGNPSNSVVSFFSKFNRILSLKRSGRDESVHTKQALTVAEVDEHSYAEHMLHNLSTAQAYEYRRKMY